MKKGHDRRHYENMCNEERDYNDFDPVNHPSHYCEGRKYEPIDVIEDWKLDFLTGNALKYISRAGRKNDESEDLEKAVFYLNRRIKQIKNKG